MDVRAWRSGPVTMAVLSALALVGCGSGGGTPSASSPSSSSSSDPASVTGSAPATSSSSDPSSGDPSSSDPSSGSSSASPGSTTRSSQSSGSSAGSSSSSSSSRPHSNANPPPGTTSYDLPTEGSDLHQQKQWEERLRSRCGDDGYPPNCLTLTYQVYKEQHGTRTAIPNPGDNYDDQDGSYDCTVTNLNPPPKARVPVGSVIRITIVCSGSANDGGSGDSSSGTSTSTSSP